VVIDRKALLYNCPLPEKSQRLIKEKCHALAEDPFPGQGGDKELLHLELISIDCMSGDHSLCFIKFEWFQFCNSRLRLSCLRSAPLRFIAGQSAQTLLKSKQRICSMIIKNNIAQKLGFWAAVLAAVTELWFSIAFGLYQPILYAPWHGMQEYADNFKVEPFIAWIVPCFLLTICFLTMMVCLHVSASEEKKIWSLLAVVFAIAYAIIISTLYYIQAVVVVHNLVHHSTDGLALWIFASPYPNSFPGALEGIGYLFMCLSLISASRLFSGDKLSKWISRSFLFSGLTGSLIFTNPLYPLPIIIVLIDVVANAIILFVSLGLTSIWFKRSLHER